MTSGTDRYDHADLVIAIASAYTPQAPRHAAVREGDRTLCGLVIHERIHLLWNTLSMSHTNRVCGRCRFISTNMGEVSP